MAQKVLNGVLSSVRVAIEHAIAGVKRLRIVRDVLRLHGQQSHQEAALDLSDQLMEVACALHNLRQHNRRARIAIPLRGFTLYC